MDAFPTPGEPSNKIGLRASCNARRRRATLRLVDGAVKANSDVEGIGCVPQLIVNDEIPNHDAIVNHAAVEKIFLFIFRIRIVCIRCSLQYLLVQISVLLFTKKRGVSQHQTIEKSLKQRKYTHNTLRVVGFLITEDQKLTRYNKNFMAHHLNRKSEFKLIKNRRFKTINEIYDVPLCPVCACTSTRRIFD